MTNGLYRLGHLAARRPWRIIGLWLAISVVVIGASSAYGRELEDTFSAPGLDSTEAVELLSAAQSDQAGLTTQVVVSPTDPTVDFFTSPEAADQLTILRSELAATENVLEVTDPAALLDQGPEATSTAGAVSTDGRVAVFRLQYPVLEDLGPEDLEHLQDTVAAARTRSATSSIPLQIEYGGAMANQLDESGLGPHVAIGLIAAIVVLLVAFGSVVAMGLPIGVALFGLAVGVSSMGLITYLVDIPAFAPELATMIGLGVGIDYALFLVTRHREHLARGLPVAEAAGLAVATAGQAVVFAGGTVVIAILGLGVAGIPFVTAGGLATSVVVLIMVIAAITVLPALLGLAGPWINRIGIHRRGHSTGTVGAGWARWGRHVADHAWAYATGVTVLLLALTAPVLALRLGSPDEGTLPESRTERRAYDLIAEGFGPGINGPMIVVIDVSEDRSVVEPLATVVAQDRGIESVTPADVNADAGVATIVAFPNTSPQDSATVETLERLRTEALPSVLAGSPAEAHIGGYTATTADLANRVSQRLPWFIAAVIGLSFVLLTMVFRSILVPLKAAILNLLSIGAGFGVLVMVFQWGWGMSLIGLEATVPIISFIPLFMFALLFGLSMDYEVFLLSRIREEYLVSGDNDSSVISGIASTARVITSAALIMISVFGAFVLGTDPTIKMFGLGLAVSIFVDATIVRIVLVPATMKLMGDANWWMPAWLDRILPTIDIEGAGAIEGLAQSMHDQGEVLDRNEHRDLVSVD